jgi:threonine dehydrogenase-like Zn-dependent dehydrogenase
MKRGKPESRTRVGVTLYRHTADHSGTVTEVPEGTETHFKVGDRVALEVGHMCGNCRYCKIGRYNLCKVGIFPEAVWGMTDGCCLLGYAILFVCQDTSPP